MIYRTSNLSIEGFQTLCISTSNLTAQADVNASAEGRSAMMEAKYSNKGENSRPICTDLYIVYLTENNAKSNHTNPNAIPVIFTHVSATLLKE